MIQCYDQVFIGIDGIDECEPVERKCIVSLLKNLSQPCEQDTIVKVLIFGCAEHDIERSLVGCNRLDLKSHHITGGIEHYVNTRLVRLNSVFRFRPQKLEEIARRIADKSAGII